MCITKASNPLHLCNLLYPNHTRAKKMAYKFILRSVINLQTLPHDSQTIRKTIVCLIFRTNRQNNPNGFRMSEEACRHYARAVEPPLLSFSVHRLNQGAFMKRDGKGEKTWQGLHHLMRGWVEHNTRLLAVCFLSHTSSNVIIQLHDTYAMEGEGSTFAPH